VGLVVVGEIAFEVVQGGAADSAGEDAEQDVVRGEGGAGEFFDLEGMVGGVEDGGFHGSDSWVAAWGEASEGAEDDDYGLRKERPGAKAPCICWIFRRAKALRSLPKSKTTMVSAAC
jgi:hypothetical protein